MTIEAVVRMPNGKPTRIKFASRAELHEYQNGILKGAKVRLLGARATYEPRNLKKAGYLDSIEMRGAR